MDNIDLVPTLALATFVLVLLGAIVGYALFKRKPANQHPMEKAPTDAIAKVPAGEPSRPTIDRI